MNNKYIDVINNIREKDILNIEKDIEVLETKLCYLNMDLMSLNKELINDINKTKIDIDILKFRKSNLLKIEDIKKKLRKKLCK